jgi:hypothetical protein
MGMGQKNTTNLTHFVQRKITYTAAGIDENIIVDK